MQTSLENSRQLSQMADLAELARKATALADALETERDISAGPITAKQEDRQNPDVLDAQKNTDQLSKAFATAADKFDELDLAGGKALLLQVRKDLNQLSEARGSAYASASFISPAATIRAAQESSSVSRYGSADSRSSGIQYARVSPIQPMVTRPSAEIALT